MPDTAATVDFNSLFARSRDIHEIPAGHVLFEEGQGGDCMYAVIEGCIRISRQGRQLDQAGPGSVIGEMALIDHAPRSATAVAVEPSRVVPVNQRQFLFMVQQTAFFAIRVMKLLAARIRAANETVR